MDELVQESSTQAAVAPGWSAGPSQGLRPAGDRRTWSVPIAVALLVIYAFIPVLANGFVAWDDEENFLDNPYFRGLGTAQFRWAWTTFLVGAYQPLAWLLFEAQYVFYQLDPRGYHLTSLFLQVANAVVLYFLTVALLVRCRTDSCLESPWICSLSAGLATALFAVHPLRVEAVAWVSCQPYLPCILFSMLAVLAYLRAFPIDSTPRWGWLVGSFLLFVAALLSHAPAVTLPAVLLILDAYPLRRFGGATGRWFDASARRALLEKIPFVLASLLFVGLAIAAKPQSRFPVEHYEASAGIARACYAIWFYIEKTVLPSNLTAVYPIPRDLNWLAFPFALCLLATMVISAGLFILRGRWPGLLAAWLCYLVVLAPNSGIIRISDQIAADRYSYMSMLSSVTLVAAGFCRLWRISSRWRPGAIGTIAIGLGLLLALLPMTRNQCRTWFDSETLWAHALSHGANSSSLAHSNLGAVLSSEGKYKAAEAQLTEALRLDPNSVIAHINQGTILVRQGKPEEAVAHFARAIRLDPGDGKAHYNLGLVLFAQGKYEEAVAHFTEALRLNPDYTDAHIGLGVVLFRQRRHAEAKAHFVDALRVNPGSVTAHFNLGFIDAERGKYEAAEAHYAEAIRLQPGHVGAHYNLGFVLSRLGNCEAAKAHYALAIRLDPGFAAAYNASAFIMATRPEARFRDGKRAVALATRACELTKWQDPRFLDTLAAAKAEAGDFDAAVSSQTRAIELLTGERQKASYRSRLVLYQSKKPYREPSSQRAPTEARP